MRKVALSAGGAIIAFYLVTAPQTAAGTVKHAGSTAGHVVHQVSVFLKSL